MQGCMYVLWIVRAVISLQSVPRTACMRLHSLKKVCIFQALFVCMGHVCVCEYVCEWRNRNLSHGERGGGGGIRRQGDASRRVSPLCGFH